MAWYSYGAHPSFMSARIITLVLKDYSRNMVSLELYLSNVS
jgi:hypothetical protein